MAAANDTRADLLMKAPLDSWVALSKDETSIVAVGSTFGEVTSKSDLAGVDDPVIVKTPKVWLPLSV